MNSLIDGRFRLDRKIGTGSFADVHLGKTIFGEKFAIKIESVKAKKPRLLWESKVYKMLAGSPCIPRVHWYGTQGGFNVLVLDLEGQSLEDRFIYCSRQFELKTICMLADQMIQRVEYVHNKNLMHCDITPENFVLGLGKRSNVVSLLDFGLTRRYRDPNTQRHIPLTQGNRLLGSARYASVNVHDGCEHSRRDDMESLGYVLMYFCHGALPWQGLRAGTKQERIERVVEKKEAQCLDGLCKEYPSQFATYLRYCRSLQFEDRPDYWYLRRLFRDRLAQEGYKHDFIFDWKVQNYEDPNEKNKVGPHIRCEAMKPPRLEPRKLDWATAPGHWDCIEIEYNGSYSTATGGKPEYKDCGSIDEAIDKMKKQPEQYLGCIYQTNMKEWPVHMQQCKLVLRNGCGFTVNGSSGGQFTYVQLHYDKLGPPRYNRHDQYTDSMLAFYNGQPLGEPVHPGRGEGVADVPTLSVIEDIDPSDVSQGTVGDCWLLSAISAMAEYDGAIAKIFERHKHNLHKMPGPDPNMYTVRLFDLSRNFQRVDVTVDERLCTKAGEGASLFGAQPSVSGELWIPILEKAVAAHCGGWDKIDGGDCAHAWKILTGCRECYTIREMGDGWQCLGVKNPNTGCYEQLGNSPNDGFQGTWPSAWPADPDGDINKKVNNYEMFQNLVEWTKKNYLICCGTRSGGGGDPGIVDGHAYTILDAMENVAGCGVDLVQVRNPWGSGELENGMWDDDGPGWDHYPAVKRFLNPVNADDGIFWMSRDEFFQYYGSVYLCAKDMGEFSWD